MSSEVAYREEVLKIEPKGVEHIDPSERHGRVGSVFTLWFGANVEFATLTAGALGVAVFGTSFVQSAVAIVLGSLLGAIFLGMLSTFGPRLGVPQLIQSRKAFGRVGNYAPGLLNFISGTMWFAVNTVLGVYALEWLLHWTFVPSLALMVILQVVIAIYGYNMIHSFERYFAIVLTIMFAVVTVYALQRAHFNYPFQAKVAGAAGPTGAFLLMTSVAFSYVLGWLPYASDYTRYLPAETPPRKVFGNAFWSVFLSCVWLELLGAALATVRPVFVPTDLVTGLLPHGLGVLAMLAVVIGTITANVLNIYSGALSALVIDIPVRRWLAALVVGALGTVFSYLGGQHGYYSHYTNFLLVLGYWIAPWLAIVVVDYFFIQRGSYHVSQFYERRRLVRTGFVVWVIAVLVSSLFFNQQLYVGPIARAVPQLGDISYYVSMVVAGVLYFVAARREPIPGEAEAAAGD